MKRRTYAQQVCVKRSGLILQTCQTLRPGSRVGIAVSGGVDSLVLLMVMKLRKAILPFPIEIMALHLNPGFAPQDHINLGPWLAENDIPGHVEITDFGPRAHSSENRKKSPCFYCAWLRRKRLFDLCGEYRLTHLAFGHNADDSAATFIMNSMRNGRLQGLVAQEDFFGGSLTVIRPLILVEKKYIRQAARQWNLPVWENACPSSGHTARSEAEEVLDSICKIIPGARASFINGLGRATLAAAAKPGKLEKPGSGD